MKLTHIQKIPFREKKAMVNEACLMYQKLKLQTKSSKEKSDGRLSDVSQETRLTNSKSFSIMDSILGLLDAESALVIENDFMKKIDRNWFLDNWSKSTYYRIKHNAIDQFLFLLYA